MRPRPPVYRPPSAVAASTTSPVTITPSHAETETAGEINYEALAIGLVELIERTEPVCEQLMLATGVDGSMVCDLVREGRMDEVATYCRDDVGERLRPVYRRLCGIGWTGAVTELAIAAPSMALDDGAGMIPNFLQEYV